jgi:ADP-ribosylglycohydrolase
MKTILILEDNEDRILAFTRALETLGEGIELKLWRDAPSMIAECQAFFPSAVLISLDHDLNRLPGATHEPGTGLEVAQYLGDFLPVCPVLIHSSNVDRVYSMQNELRFSGWLVERVGPLGENWIETSWLQNAKRLLADHKNTWKAELPPDHAERMERVRLSLDGLGLGDSLGEAMFFDMGMAPRRLAEGHLPSAPWFHTDDTEMAISIAAVLNSHGFIHQDALAKRFARRYERDRFRGYGPGMRSQLCRMMTGTRWQDTSKDAFGGQGSMGNGSAMRVAPLGGYFADDLVRCAEQARDSSLVTHAHPEGVAGAIAIAIAAAMACQLNHVFGAERADRLFASVLEHTPESRVREGIVLANKAPASAPVADVARVLGNGCEVTCPNTVPFCVWMAAHHLGSFVAPLGKTMSVGGDCDTNAAIVCGILALSVGRDGLPPGWLAKRETVRI